MEPDGEVEAQQGQVAAERAESLVQSLYQRLGRHASSDVVGRALGNALVSEVIRKNEESWTSHHMDLFLEVHGREPSNAESWPRQILSDPNVLDWNSDVSLLNRALDRAVAALKR